MRIISFAYTSAPLLAGAKIVTRRKWNDKYAWTFKEGEHIQAYSRQPRFKGVKIAEIVLTATPNREYTKFMHDREYYREGFHFMRTHNILINGKLPDWDYWRSWKSSDELLWTVRFDLTKIIESEFTDELQKKYNFKLKLKLIKL